MRTLVFSLFFLLAIVGCDQQAVIDRFTPKEESAIAKNVLAQLKAREFLEVERQLDVSLQGPNLRSLLEQMAQQIPTGEPKSIKVIGAFTKSNTTSKAVTYDLTFEYEYPASWLVAKVVLERNDTKVTVMGMHVNATAQSLEESNGFSLAGKSVLHYFVFALAILIPMLVISALVLCFKTPIPKRKWIWYVFIAIGFVQFSLDWTSGTFNIQPLSFLFFGAGFSQAGIAGPFVLTIALPIGAIVFLFKRRALGRARDDIL